jgi:hypothetical protein
VDRCADANVADVGAEWEALTVSRVGELDLFAEESGITLDFERSMAGGFRLPPVGTLGGRRVAIATIVDVPPTIGGGLLGINTGASSTGGGGDTSSCRALKFRFFLTIGVDMAHGV